MNRLLLSALVLSLSACQGGDPPQPPGPTELTGPVRQVVLGTPAQFGNWSRGAGTLELRADSVVLASAPLKADGSFRLTLPTPSASLLASPTFDCGGDRAYSTPAGVLFPRLRAVVGGAGTALGWNTLSGDPERICRLVYVDQDTIVRGTETCSTRTVVYDVTLKRGWNWWNSSREREGGVTRERVTSGPAFEVPLSDYVNLG